MQDMRRRIDRGDIEKEKEEIIQVCNLPNYLSKSKREKHFIINQCPFLQAMCDIANDRARKLLQS